MLQGNTSEEIETYTGHEQEKKQSSRTYRTYSVLSSHEYPVAQW